MPKNQQGFTLIELMIVVAIIGILAATAVPFLKDYTTRSKISEVLLSLATAKTAVGECMISNWSVTGCESNGQAGMPAPADTGTQYLESMTVGAGGVITAAIQGTGIAELDATAIAMIPTLNLGSGITWECQIQDATLTKYVPLTCR